LIAFTFAQAEAKAMREQLEERFEERFEATEEFMNQRRSSDEVSNTTSCKDQHHE
jgi:hypothetical protein